ncbi:MAG: glycosyltransferase [Candidatus Eremiobacteraeota bacterium]|nr:glycosyltransferase [Candidatus Eremiobacteraeota bacterium]
MPIRISSKRAAAPVQQAVPFELPSPPPGQPQKPAGLSLCMIVKNEERFLEQCLRSVQGIVDEICIVDTGSTDRTIEIAKRFGARVEVREWRNDFAWARNEAIAMATRRWVFMLDADEELKPESVGALQLLKNAPAHTTGVWVRCYNKSDDYRGTGDMSHVLVRLFPNDERIRFRGMIHEFVTLDDSRDGLAAVMAPISIVHHGYLKDVVESRNKAQRNFEIVEAAARANPDDPYAWFNVGSTAFLMRNYDRAREALEKMRALNGGVLRGFIANGYSILAEVYSDKLGDAKKGEEVALGALQFSPRYANAHFQLGKALVAQGRLDDARAAFLEAIEDGKYTNQQFVVDDQVSIWKAHSEIGSTYVMQGDEASAIAWFRKGLINAPDVQPLMLNLARALERTGNFDEANEYFRDVFEKFRDDYGTIDYVNFLLRRREHDAALTVINEMHQVLADEAATQLLIAAAHISAGTDRDEDAFHYLSRAARRSPGNADVLNALEAYYQSRGDTQAIKELREQEASTPAKSNSDFLRRSYLANVSGNYEGGLALAQAGLADAPSHEHLHYNAALAASALGRSDTALEHLAHVLTVDAAVYIPARLLQAAIFQRQSRLDDATAAVERVLAIDGTNIEALKLKADLAEKRGDSHLAESALRALLATDRERGAVELAAYLLRCKRFEEAAKVAQDALG